MPELPEVETVARGLRDVLVGRRLRQVTVRRANLRLPFPAGFGARLTGRRIISVARRAKYLVITCDDDTVLLAHLGMSGRFVITPQRPEQFAAHDHVILETDDGCCIRYHDARRFGLMQLATSQTLARHPLLAHLGFEPLSPDFTSVALSTALARRQTPIKSALLNQKIIAGIGNIYACEALFGARLSPCRLAASLIPPETGRLVAAIQSVLTRAIAAGGSSLRDHVQPTGELGYFQNDWAVYGRKGQPCPECDCDSAIQRITQANRSTFYCPRRQV